MYNKSYLNLIPEINTAVKFSSQTNMSASFGNVARQGGGFLGRNTFVVMT